MNLQVAFGRSVLVSLAFGVAHVGFAGCGSSDESKHPRESGDAGEGGVAEGSGGSAKPMAGTAGDGGGNQPQGGDAPLAGASRAGGAPDAGGAAGAPDPGTAGDNGGGAGGEGGVDGVEGGQGGVAGAALGGAAGQAGDNSAAGAGGAEGCVPETVASRISIAFDTANAERVTNLQWTDSDGTLIANVAASGGPLTCNDPSEFFGGSYGVIEGATPNVIVPGSRSTAAPCGTDMRITSTPTNCNGQAQIPAFTEYHFYESAQASQMRVTRTIYFDETSPVYTGVGVRPWQPRVKLGTFPQVIIPKASDTEVTVRSANTCGGDCVIPVDANWNGRWFADISNDPTGLAIIVLRDPAMTSTVSLTVNWDSFSTSNLSSFVVMKPQGGWKAPITEVEYLCFADFKSWPQTARDAAQLPSWCGP